MSDRVRFRPGALALGALAIWLGGCAGSPLYSTAKMLPPGGIEIAPHATGFYAAIPDTYADDFGPQLMAFGGVAGYGLSEAFSLMGSYDWTRLETGIHGRAQKDHRTGVDLKYGFDRIHNAISIGYGYHSGLDMHEGTVAGYSNWYFNRRIYYCFSPTMIVYGGDWGAGTEWALNAVVNQSMTWEPGGGVFIRPQVGLNFPALFASVFLANIGLAMGAGF